MKPPKFILIFFLFMTWFNKGPINAQTENITIISDQLIDTNTALMQGFINGGASYNVSLTEKLKPQFWGFGWDVTADYDYITPTVPLAKMASIYSAYMSYFSIGDPLTLQPWTDGYVQWDAFVTGMVNQSISTSRPIDFWSVWGEPDVSFSGTPMLYAELFRRTDSILHMVDPMAKMVGPDFINYEIDDLLFFIDSMHDLNIHPAAISWHEFGSDPADIVLHTQQFRDSLVARPWAGDPEIHIQEYGDPNNRLIPGWGVGWLYNFEQAQVDWASRACFNEYDGTNVWDDCWQGLSGMYMMDGVTPQPLYWLHRAYAELNKPQRLTTTSTQTRTQALASKNDLDEEMKIIVGRYHSSLQGSPNLPANVDIKIRHYPYGNNSTLPIVIQRIPAQDDIYSESLLAPITVSIGSLAFTGDSAIVSLPGFADGDAYVIYINPSAGSLLSTENMHQTILDNSKVLLYPNPAKDIASISGLEGYEYISIVDALGKVVFESSIQNETMNIDLSDHPVGLYSIILRSKENLVVKKLILQ